MKFNNVSILSVSSVDAPIRVTSRELGERLLPTLERIGLDADFIENLTGIVARRFWDDHVMPSDAATWAGEKAIEAAGIDRSKIGIIINASVCRDFVEPSTACLVHAKLGLAPECINYDLGNACLAFVNSMEIIAAMIERGRIDYGLIVDGEGSRYTVECTINRLLAPDCDISTFRDNFATLTLGSGGAAMILTRSDLAEDNHALVGSVSLAATEHNHLCRGQMERMVTDAHGLLVAGLELAGQTFKKAGEELGWTSDCLDQIITHQISAVHTTKFCSNMGLNEDILFKTFPEFGNIGPAAVPITLCKAIEAGRVRKGDRIGLMGIGSGINCSMMEVVW
jgi:acyl-CoA:acyl-CoA alkyltransferase